LILVLKITAPLEIPTIKFLCAVVILGRYNGCVVETKSKTPFGFVIPMPTEPET